MKVAILFLFSTSAYAAGDGHGSPADLIPAFVNVTILGCLIFYFAKDAVRDLFKNKSRDVKEVLDRASVKAAEAQKMMEMQQAKVAGAQDEIKGLEQEAATELSDHKKNYVEEVDARIANLESEAVLKVEAEKKSLLDKLNSKLLEEVLGKAKSKLTKDTNLNMKATQKIVEGIQK